jgi:serine/threonine protein kinase
LRADGHIVLADFGMSKMFTPSELVDAPTSNPDDSASIYSTDTDTGHSNYVTNEVCGTPYYMAPEMHYGDNYSFEVDFWSLGVTLFRMVTGHVRPKSLLLEAERG